MAANTLQKNRKTPGVYVTEFSAFPPSVVGVETAVPIFIGYTETAMDPSSKKQVYLQAIQLNSMADYYSYFGKGYDTQYVVSDLTPPPTPTPSPTPTPTPTATPTTSPPVTTTPAPAIAAYDFEAPMSYGPAVDSQTVMTGQYLVGTTSVGGTIVPRFNLYLSMQLFFANGGGSCFVVSVNNYWGKQSVDPTPDATATTVSAADLMAGLTVANDTRGGTMLVIPDACLLSTTDYGSIAVAMMKQASELQDRVAILDLPGALDPATWSKTAMKAQADTFYEAIAPAQLYFSYGAAYGPAVESSVLGTGDVDYTNLQGSDSSTLTMNNLLTTQAQSLYATKNPDGTYTATDTFNKVTMRIAAAFPVAAVPTPTPSASATESSPPPTSGGSPRTGVSGGLLVSLPDPTVPAPTTADGISSLEQYLLNATPLLGQVLEILVGKLNVAPASGIMAGIWTQNDANRGVWNAPANISLNEVIAPKVLLTDADQGDYNVPLNGNAIDILRAMVNRGTVVWGARTLDGNSLDYRYIQVRRTLIYIEQSIKNTLAGFVFAANDAGTWATVTASISNFLTQFWQAGGLMGAKASEAFTVQCGVPTTMTGLDVLNGYMIVNVTVQLIHPAEFIELTFTQTMQGV
jgi:hypothetical protein